MFTGSRGRGEPDTGALSLDYTLELHRMIQRKEIKNVTLNLPTAKSRERGMSEKIVSLAVGP